MGGTLNIGSPSSTSPLPTTTGYYVDGTKVIGGQAAAIANDDPATTANLILVALRAHGLIAP